MGGSGGNEREDLRVYEGLHFGPITCAVVPTGTRILITGSADSTVRVWKLASVTGRGAKQTRQLALLQTLCGHEGAITCMAAEPAFSVLVTGSECGICIIWVRVSFILFVSFILEDTAGIIIALVSTLMTPSSILLGDSFYADMRVYNEIPR